MVEAPNLFMMSDMGRSFAELAAYVKMFL